MRPDNTAPIITAARQRHELTRSKAIQALRELDQTGAPVTFQTVARAAAVSRSWLYAQPDIRAEIQRLRDITHPTSTPPIPTRQRASDPSLLTRLDAAHKRIGKLTDENQRLRRQLTHALGEQRHASSTTPPPPSHGAARRSSVTIGPH